MYVVINQGTDWNLSGLDDPVELNDDLHATRARRATPAGWTARDSEISFLALDRNGNGTIDGPSELFGSQMLLANGRRAPNGFAALKEYDSNGDGLIDQRDDVWSSLVLWTDRNHDGVVQSYELVPISASRVTAIELLPRWSGRRDRFGNTFRYESAVHIGDQVRAFYEVSFVTPR
jgi:hypothetical protein